MPVTSGRNVQNTFSFGLAVDERTRNKLHGVQFWVHMFSGLFGPAVDKRTRNIDMGVRVKVALCWRTDIRRWRIDFIRWRSGRWRSDSLAKRPACIYLYGLSFKINIELTGTVLLCVYISVYLYLFVVGSKVNGSTCIFSCILLNISVLE